MPKDGNVPVYFCIFPVLNLQRLFENLLADFVENNDEGDDNP